MGKGKKKQKGRNVHPPATTPDPVEGASSAGPAVQEEAQSEPEVKPKIVQYSSVVVSAGHETTQGAGKGEGSGLGRGKELGRGRGKELGRGRGSPWRGQGVGQDRPGVAGEEEGAVGGLPREGGEKGDKLPIPKLTPVVMHQKRNDPQQPPSPTKQSTLPSKGAQPPTKELAGLKIDVASSHLAPIRRPNFGTKGEKIMLKANFFPVNINEDVTICHYDVDIKPEVRNKAKSREIVREFVKQSGMLFHHIYPVFDGKKNMYTHRQLPITGEKHGMSIKLEGDNPNSKPFYVAIQLAAQIPLYSLVQFLNGETRECPQNAIQALDIVFREKPSNHFIPITQYFFTDRRQLGPRERDPAGLEFWNGYYQSVRPTAWKAVMLQVDSSVRIFHKGQKVLELLDEFFGRGARDKQLSDRQYDIFYEHIKGLAVEIDTDVYPELTKRSYRLIGLSARPASLQQFPMSQEAGPDIPCKVADYFMTQYNLRLRYPHLRCLRAQPKEKHRYIPMELCVVRKGQQLKKLSDELTSQLIKYSAKPAPQRKQEINKIVDSLKFPADEIIAAFGISVSKEMVAFEGRVLPAPAIEYKDKQKASILRVRDGSWNMRDVQFYTGARVKQMAVLCFDNGTSEDNLWNFCEELSKAANKVGLSMPVEPCSVSKLRYANEIYEKISHLLQEFNALNLIIVVMPRTNNKNIYGEVKRVGDIEIGVTTQCVLPKNVWPTIPQKLTNICLKINAKLGETNAVIPSQTFSRIMNEPVIIMGADVTHPAPGDSSQPSIAAVTGSCDKHAFKYAARISMQTHCREIIEDLKDITVALLENFRQKTLKEPQKIIFYRDGVSEGQFKEVLASELQAIQQACFACSPNYKPLITFIVVRKRHHTRLFCDDASKQVGKSCNIPPGTTVDKYIVHPLEFDFYLNSHAGIQGTNRSAHYHVLYDDSEFTADDIQELTYQLCHLYARCTRSVSIPAPVYYAHHSAFRGRFYLDRQLEHGETSEGNRLDAAELKAMTDRCLLHQDYRGMFFA